MLRGSKVDLLIFPTWRVKSLDEIPGNVFPIEFESDFLEFAYR